TLQWKEDLEADLGILHNLWNQIVDITAKEDRKLQRLISLLEEKVENPFNPGNKKAIVFTAFADTANYLFEHVKDHFKSKYNINKALITGSRKISTSKAIPADINAILTCFSPRSKDKDQLYPNISDSIDLLIAT